MRFFMSLGEVGDPKKSLDIFFGGGDPKKNGNFQIFTHPPPLVNNERSLKRIQQIANY